MLDFIEASLRADRPFVAAAQRSPGRSADDAPRTLGIGYAHRTIGDQAWLWHNGGTGGFRSYFGFDPALDFGLVVLTNGTGNADRLAEVLIRSGAPPLPVHDSSWFGILMALMGVVIAPVTLLTGLFARSGAERAAPGASKRRRPDRLDLFVAVAGAGMLLVVSRLAGDWMSVSFFLWWLGLVTTLGAALALFRFRFGERAWRTGGVPSLAGRLLLAALFLVVIVAFA